MPSPFAKHVFFVFGMLSIAAGVETPLAAQAQYSATLSTAPLQTIKGWGCHAFEGTVPATVTQAFCSDLGMTIDRIYLGSDIGSDDQGNVNPGHMDSVCDAISNFTSHNISYIVCSWSPNKGMKNPPAPGYLTGTLRKDHEVQFENYFVNVCKYIKNKGLPLPIAISIQNEPTNDVPYDSMHFAGEDNSDYSQYYRVIKAVRAKLDASGFSSIHLLGPEVGSVDGSLEFLGGSGFPALKDPALNAAIWGVSSHGYFGGVGLEQQWADGADKWSKDRWQTEYCSLSRTAAPVDMAILNTRRLISDMLWAKDNYWFWWDGYAPWGININEKLLDVDGVTKYPTFYILSKIFKGAPPGSVVRRISSSDPALVTYNDNLMDAVAFVNGASTTVVLVNPTGSARTTSVNRLNGASAQVYQTTSTQNMELIDSPKVSDGAISSVNMAPWSVTVIYVSGGVLGAGAPIGHRIALYSNASHKYVSCDGKQQYTLIGEASVVGTPEIFDVYDAGNGNIALKAEADNKYVACSADKKGALTATTSGAIGTREQLRWESQGSNIVAMFSPSNNKYVTCDLYANNLMVAQWANDAGSWEGFTWSDLGKY